LRENDAELESVGRPAIDGDLVTIDLHGNDESGAEVVGSTTISTRWEAGTITPELDVELRGAKAGDILAFTSPAPGDEDEVISFRVLVKDVKVKKLPEPTDEWAAESSEFATVAELRADISDRMARVKLVQSQMALREKTVEAVAGLVDDGDVPEVLVDSEVNERLHDLQHRLEAQKLGLGEYLQATGRTPDDLLAAVRTTPSGRSRLTWPSRPGRGRGAHRERRRARRRNRHHGPADGNLGRRAAPSARHGRTDGRGTLGATKGQGAAVAAGPRGALRRRR
jgi:FKBP-type peptidyl-prolyl cis-trans isomerase (trigger factor)